jgi:hypothetical protein
MSLINRPDKPDKPSEGQPKPETTKSGKTFNRIGTTLAALAVLNSVNIGLNQSSHQIKQIDLKEAVAEQVVDKGFLQEDLGDLIAVNAKIAKESTPERQSILQSQQVELKRLVDLDEKILKDTNSEVSKLEADIANYPNEMLLPAILQIALMLGSAKSFSDAKKEEFLNKRRAIIESNPSQRELAYVHRLNIIFDEQTGRSPDESENF